MIKLTKEQVLLLHSDLIKETGGTDGIRDNNLLESALNAPFQVFSIGFLGIFSPHFRHNKSPAGRCDPQGFLRFYPFIFFLLFAIIIISQVLTLILSH